MAILVPLFKGKGAIVKQITRQYAFIAVLGFIGAALRYAIGLIMPASSFPAGTLTVNLIGCFLLEITYNYLGRRLHLPKELIGAIGVGLLGAFTTMSSFSRESMQLILQGDFLSASIYIAASFVGCFMAAVCGHLCCRVLARKRLDRILAQRKARQKQKNGDSL
jgi:CrcB protein